MAATLNRILKKVEDLGDEYFVIHSEIKPYGPGTRRFILGKHTELPQKVKKLPKIKGVREIMYPGQSKYQRYKKNKKKDINLPKKIYDELQNLLK